MGDWVEKYDGYQIAHIGPVKHTRSPAKGGFDTTEDPPGVSSLDEPSQAFLDLIRKFYPDVFRGGRIHK
jgi:hypothetical protein